MDTHEVQSLTIGAVRGGPGAVVFGQMVLKLQKAWITAVLCIHLGRTDAGTQRQRQRQTHTNKFRNVSTF